MNQRHTAGGAHPALRRAAGARCGGAAGRRSSRRRRDSRLGRRRDPRLLPEEPGAAARDRRRGRPGVPSVRGVARVEPGGRRRARRVLGARAHAFSRWHDPEVAATTLAAPRLLELSVPDGNFATTATAIVRNAGAGAAFITCQTMHPSGDFDLARRPLGTRGAARGYADAGHEPGRVLRRSGHGLARLRRQRRRDGELDEDHLHAGREPDEHARLERPATARRGSAHSPRGAPRA